MSETAPDIREEPTTKPKETEGPLYRVIIHNDDVTPMDFVLYVLRAIFLLDGIRAVQIMYTAHYHGSAYVQTLPKNEAQQRVHRAHYTAAVARYPLHFTIEPD